MLTLTPGHLQASLRLSHGESRSDGHNDTTRPTERTYDGRTLPAWPALSLFVHGRKASGPRMSRGVSNPSRRAVPRMSVGERGKPERSL